MDEATPPPRQVLGGFDAQLALAIERQPGPTEFGHVVAVDEYDRVRHAQQVLTGGIAVAVHAAGQCDGFALPTSRRRHRGACEREGFDQQRPHPLDIGAAATVRGGAISQGDIASGYRCEQLGAHRRQLDVR